MSREDGTTSSGVAVHRTETTEGYEALRACFEEAYNRASKGKGLERHGLGLDFQEQPIMHIPRTLGNTGFTLGQIMKKAGECSRMDRDRAINELLDIMVYAAATVMYLQGTYK